MNYIYHHMIRCCNDKATTATITVTCHHIPSPPITVIVGVITYAIYYHLLPQVHNHIPHLGTCCHH